MSQDKPEDDTEGACALTGQLGPHNLTEFMDSSAAMLDGSFIIPPSMSPRQIDGWKKRYAEDFQIGAKYKQLGLPREPPWRTTASNGMDRQVDPTMFYAGYDA